MTTFKKYKATFVGRTKNAIGIFYPITDTVEANSEDEARIKLYDKYEHIRRLKLEEIKNEDSNND